MIKLFSNHFSIIFLQQFGSKMKTIDKDCKLTEDIMEWNTTTPQNLNLLCEHIVIKDIPYLKMFYNPADRSIDCMH